MSKASNQLLIDAIADGQPNTAEGARLAWTALNDELYPAIYSSSFLSPLKTQALTSGINYNFNFSKSGNRVTLSGVIINLTAKTANTNLLEFTDSDFFGKNNGTTITSQLFRVEDKDFRITNGVISCVDSLESGKTEGYRFNITYFTND